MDVSRLHRVLRLLTLLQGDEPRRAGDLAAELGVSRRTLFRDLKILEAAGVPYYNEAGKGYRIRSTFFLPPVNLKVTEALGLMTLAKVASAQGDQPLLAPASEAVRKLIAMMPAALRGVCNEMMSRVSVEPAAPAFGAGTGDHHAALQRAIDERRVVRMRYHSLFEGGEIGVHLHPHHLHFAVRAWYVIGHSEEDGDVRTYKLMRIRGLELTGRRFRRDKPFDVKGYLGLAWNLIPEGRVYRVELEFSAKVGTNVSEVRWHSTQRQELLEDGRCLMSFEVDGLNEISWWLLGYGDQVVVREPGALRERMKRFYRAALERYEAEDGGGDEVEAEAAGTVGWHEHEERR